MNKKHKQKSIDLTNTFRNLSVKMKNTRGPSCWNCFHAVVRRYVQILNLWKEEQKKEEVLIIKYFPCIGSEQKLRLFE